jgi:hypothetical protein
MEDEMKFHSFLGMLISCSVSMFFGFLGFLAYSVNEVNMKLSVIIERVAVHSKQIESLESRMTKNDQR